MVVGAQAGEGQRQFATAQHAAFGEFGFAGFDIGFVDKH